MNVTSWVLVSLALCMVAWVVVLFIVTRDHKARKVK